MGFLESFAVSLSMAVLKWAATRAGVELYEYVTEREEMKANKEKADKYKEVVANPGSSREERRNAEDNLLR